jgi:hypothetical protein
MQRISIKPYREAIEGVVLQFDLLRYAINRLGNAQLKRFIALERDKNISLFQEGLKHAVDSGVLKTEDATGLSDMVIGEQKKKYRKLARRGTLRFYPEFTEDRLNQSELLLLIAHFESFMRIVHKAFLKLGHSKVFYKAFRGKQNAPTTIKEVFAPNFLPGMIEKEVKWLDSQSIALRADYFEEHFRVKFGNAKDLERLDELFKRRNEISHHVFRLPPNEPGEIEEPPLVSDRMIRDARQLLSSIPSEAVRVGAKTYQSCFQN